MASIKAFRGIDMFDTATWYGTVVEASSRRITISDGELTGSYIGNFFYDYLGVYGELTGYTIALGGRTAVTVTDFSVDAYRVFVEVESGDATDAYKLILRDDDRITGSDRADSLRGFGGDDVVRGRGGDDRINGDGGDDRIHGDHGHDTLFGNDGSDQLFGGHGRDKLFGGAARDTLVGGQSDDTLSGGKGKDTFVFDRISGEDVIVDFENRLDVIEITSGAQEFADLTVSAANGATIITFAQSVIVLEDTRLKHIGAEDFLFS